jgi:DMSO/TMAO reductase YedYZ molybdopterin-dependent catalytic subunit
MGQPESRAGEPELPPGQRLQRGWPVTHYGPVPKFRAERWEFRVFGATADGGKHCWSHEQFSALPYETVVADLHCVTKYSIVGAEWGGVPTATVLRLAPPADDVTHVMVWAEYGFSANMRLEDFAAPRSLFATHRAGELLTAEHGFPVRLVVPHLYAW